MFVRKQNKSLSDSLNLFQKEDDIKEIAMGVKHERTQLSESIERLQHRWANNSFEPPDQGTGEKRDPSASEHIT